jgi:hypothetical protein
MTKTTPPCYAPFPPLPSCSSPRSSMAACPPPRSCSGPTIVTGMDASSQPSSWVSVLGDAAGRQLPAVSLEGWEEKGGGAAASRVPGGMGRQRRRAAASRVAGGVGRQRGGKGVSRPQPAEFLGGVTLAVPPRLQHACCCCFPVLCCAIHVLRTMTAPSSPQHTPCRACRLDTDHTPPCLPPLPPLMHTSCLPLLGLVADLELEFTEAHLRIFARLCFEAAGGVTGQVHLLPLLHKTMTTMFLENVHASRGVPPCRIYF